ncbi:MAG: homoserine dehydrogenase [Bacteroidetes bacterium]|nr:homoserine dehydrogenase [Bacteroidota bacterium]
MASTTAISIPKRLETLRIGMFGLGVVGSGVWRVLNEKRREFASRFGIDVSIERVCVRDGAKDRDADLPLDRITLDPQDILTDESIEVVIELMGGRYEAQTVIEAALKARKHVITANKLLLAHELPRLRTLAERNGVNLYYSASVCGSVPVLRALDDHRAGDTVEAIRGIVNGSTNFILTSMTDNNLSYGDALVLARERGFLEADPTLDVSGQDAAQKLSVLVYHAFGKHIAPDRIETIGIETITDDRIAAEKEQGNVVKLIAEARLSSDGEILARVAPQSITREHLFAATRDEFNALEITARHAGPQILYGKGAGSFPTASAVISDVVELLRERL